MPRWLLSMERPVPLDRRDLYDHLWQRLLRQADAAGLHAWRFRAAGRQDRFLEFLEAAHATALDDPAIAATLGVIQQQAGVAESRRWEEVTSDG
jgi:hypothetical protein